MSEDTSAIERLEELVHRASARLRELRAENAELTERVAGLERDAEARIAEAGEAWQSERDELVERVEKLVAGLDELLAVAED